jgi:hypothetical protein
MHLATFAIILAIGLPLAFAQFPFFDQLFGQHQHQQQQQRPSGPSQWNAYFESGTYMVYILQWQLLNPILGLDISVSCSQYLCPTTLDCVTKPAQCPCPDVQDIKCIIPDAQDNEAATVVCVRGQHECKEVERLMRAK